jgi:hypothetical protein
MKGAFTESPLLNSPIVHPEHPHVHHRAKFLPFFRKIWWWNILIDVVLMIGNIYLLHLLSDGEDYRDIRLLIILWIASMLHLLYLLCVFIIHAFKKPRFIAGLLFLHMVAIVVLMYVFYTRFTELAIAY